ncbi:MAG: hypothetical protein AB7E04_06825 [Desulfobacteraceae bacterium]
MKLIAIANAHIAGLCWRHFGFVFSTLFVVIFIRAGVETFFDISLYSETKYVGGLCICFLVFSFISSWLLETLPDYDGETHEIYNYYTKHI